MLHGQSSDAGDGKFADLDGGPLGAWIAGSIPELGPPLWISKFSGGQSNPTYRVACAGGEMVLRRKPFGATLPSAHAVDREYRLISALHPAGFPVARPIAYCDDPAVIGAPFYAMDLVEGRTFWDGGLPELARAERAPIYRSLVETLARLHNLDPAAVGLADYGAPGSYVERQTARWTKQYRAAATEQIDDVERLIAWLPQSLPRQDRVSIIHGDYRIDNLIFAPASNAVRAVLDWELSTLGDPLADFAYLAMNWAMPAGERRSQLGGIDFEAEGIPELGDIVAQYCALTGRDALPDLNWYFAYNLFRLVGILQGIRKRIIDGNASSPKAEEAAIRIRPLAARAWDFARAAGA